MRQYVSMRSAPCMLVSISGSSVCRHKAEQNHPMVAAMQACGCILLGKTNLHELGVSPLGLNMHYGITRNPYNPACFAGGSSSGSAAVVAAGLCPFAIGDQSALSRGNTTECRKKTVTHDMHCTSLLQ